MKVAILVLCLIGSVLAKRQATRRDPRQPPKQDNRIVNGRDAKISSFPFMVSIRIRNTHHCGGTLLNEEWILTAAHCMVFIISEFPIEDFSGQFGNTEISPDGTNVVKFSKLIPHEGYKSRIEGDLHDIGLIKLAKPISNPPKGFRVKLPHRGSNVLTGSRAVTAGWGLNKTWDQTPMGPEPQKILQEVDIFAISAYECSNFYKKIREIFLEDDIIFKLDIHETNICAYFTKDFWDDIFGDDGEDPDEKDVKGICSGDDGGPLLIDGVQVGIASFGGDECAQLPATFTAVSHYVKWIAEKTGINLEPNIFLRSEAKLKDTRREKELQVSDQKRPNRKISKIQSERPKAPRLYDETTKLINES